MAKRLPRAQPRLSQATVELTQDKPSSQALATSTTPVVPWDERFASFLERVMATAVAGGDPKPLQVEYDRLVREAPPEMQHFVNKKS